MSHYSNITVRDDRSHRHQTTTEELTVPICISLKSSSIRELGLALRNVRCCSKETEEEGLFGTLSDCSCCGCSGYSSSVGGGLDGSGFQIGPRRGHRVALLQACAW